MYYFSLEKLCVLSLNNIETNLIIYINKVEETIKEIPKKKKIVSVKKKKTDE